MDDGPGAADPLPSDSGSALGHVGDTVVRRARRWSPAVHELLGHLRRVGFEAAPQVLGFDAQGNEILRYIDGASGADAWREIVSEGGLRAFARLLRTFHDAVRDYVPTTANWATERHASRPGEVITHGDFGPWNTVWREGEPVGLIDWDMAGPRPPLCDVAYALEYAAPFRSDEECTEWLHYPAPPDRARRMAIFAETYGLSSTAGLVDAVAEMQERTLGYVIDLASEGIDPQKRWVAEGHLDQLRERIDWTRAHRELFE
jgi:thiamine kinase-like enzyme